MGIRPAIPVFSEPNVSKSRYGGLGNRAAVVEYHAMLVTARERIEKLYRKGKTEKEVIALRPLRDYDATWAPNEAAAIANTRNVYNSFNRL